MRLDIDEHKSTDKSFYVTLNGVYLNVDYDDVDHARVDAVISTLSEVIEKHWDDNTFKLEWMKELKKRWESDKYMQYEYPRFADLMKDVGCVLK